MEEKFINLTREYAKNRGEFDLDQTYDFHVQKFNVNTIENEDFVMVEFERVRAGCSKGNIDPTDEGGQYIFNTLGELLFVFILDEIRIVSDYIHNQAVIEKADFLAN